MLAISTSLYKIATQHGLNRINFLCIISALIIVGLYLYSKTKIQDHKEAVIHINKEAILTILVGIAFTLLLVFVFRGKIFSENFSEGGIEKYYVAHSLKTHIVPYGDLEFNGKFGLPIADPVVTVPLMNLSNMLLFGESEGAVRLHFFLYVLLLFLLLSRFAYTEKKLNILCLTIFFILFAIISLFYFGHNAYFEDIAAAVGIPLFTLFFTAGIYFLLDKNKSYFLISAFLSILTLWSGIALIPILLLSYKIYYKDSKYFKCILLGFITFFLIIALSYVVYGKIHGYLQAWHHSIKIEYLNELFYSLNKIEYITIFWKYLIFWLGGLPILTLVCLKHKDKTVKLFSLITILYLPVVFKSSYINLHYFVPIIFLPFISYLRLTSNWRKKYYFISRWLILTLLTIAIFISWPKQYFVHTVYRNFGEKVCMLFSSFEEAYLHRDINDLNYINNSHFTHYIDVETIPYYATITLDPRNEYSYYITDTAQPPKEGLKLLARNDSIFLFVRDKEEHSIINKNFETYPTRQNIAHKFFKDLFEVNISFDDQEKNYLYY